MRLIKVIINYISHSNVQNILHVYAIFLISKISLGLETKKEICRMRNLISIMYSLSYFFYHLIEPIKNN